ncbi:terminase ATPase subunit family protein [Plasticicumulans sp.]|uniref:terminase ATPase subunit family protein n=1 Tax=Plasticicumulans sp. TaxID=2307179 RepID=UPI003220244F
MTEFNDPRRYARSLYWQGWRVSHIARHLDLAHQTVNSWKSRDGWDSAPVIERVESTLEARMVQLIAKDQKEGRDFKEIDLLGRQIERLARVRRYEAPGGNEGDLNPRVANRNRGPKRQPRRNEISEEQATRIAKAFEDSLFGYQRQWKDALLTERIRDILKSRQIGATWYFAREAFADAVANAGNQIFLSASKAQAFVFRQYIVQFAREAADVELSGDPIVLANGATLYFLGTNARTAQSYHGNLYMDEYFWIPRFQELRKVASGMAMHKKWRQTYFSTPSSLTHEAYPFWSGALFNRGRLKAEQVQIDTSHAALARGMRCADGQWRQVVTVEDAMAGGCDLFDLDQLRMEYAPPEFANLLMCQFVDDTASVFPLAMMQRCMVDSWVEWIDFKPFAARPLGDRPVLVGYDPALSGDGAGCVVVAPPAVPGGKFRGIEKHRWRGMDFTYQAEQIKQITERYNVIYIGIDTTGVGAGVCERVRKFFPAVTTFSYSPEVKSRLVLKAFDVIHHGRMEFDAGWTDVAQAFMAIRKTTTASGRQMTYQAGRTDDIGHSDLAWAVMHALAFEPLEGNAGAKQGLMEIY